MSNPEFRKCRRIAFAPYRLLLDPLLFALMLAAAHSLADDFSGFAKMAMSLAIGGFFLLTLLTGGVQIVRAMGREFEEGTWDSQRLSSLPAWSMVWGKLAGIGLNAWFDGLLCLAVFVVAAWAQGWPSFDVLWCAVAAIALVVAAHALCLFAPLSAHWQSGQGKVGGWLMVLVCLFGFNAYSKMIRWQVLGGTVDWWGMEWRRLPFLAASLLALAVWSLVGTWLSMRRELQAEDSLWRCLGWPVFLLFWLFWAMGFAVVAGKAGGLSLFLPIAAFGLWGAVYLPLLLERKNRTHWQRFFAAWQRRDWSRVGSLFPNWLSGFALALVFGLCATAFGKGHLWFPVLALFVVRDLALVLWLNLNAKLKRPDGLAAVLLLMLYVVCPLFFIRTPLQYAFTPLLSLKANTGIGQIITGIALPAAQAALCLWLLKARWEALEERQPQAA
jgi:hypothetical protein